MPPVVETTPTASISGGKGKKGEDDEIDFTVTLDESATGTVSVDYATADGTADAGDDYTAKSGTLSFDAGETSKTVSVSIEDDTENESDETFTVTLSSASGADLGTKTATGTIRKRTVVVETTPTVSIAGASGTESDDNSIDFTVTLDEAGGPADGQLQQLAHRARRKRVHLRPRLQRERGRGLRSGPRRCAPRNRRHDRESPAQDPGQQPELDHHG